jgi:hypothetical protein
MTRHDDKRMDVLERALIHAYRSQTDDAADVDVRQTVMREIRRSAAAQGRWAPAAVLDQLVWRTATITAAVVLTATMVTVGLLRTQAPDSPALVAEDFESVPLFED